MFTGISEECTDSIILLATFQTCLIPWRWRQKVTAKHLWTSTDYTASHPRKCRLNCHRMHRNGQFSNAVTCSLFSTEVRHIQKSRNALCYIRNFLYKALVITIISIMIAYVHKRRMSHHFKLGYFVIWRLREWTCSAQH
jgi:hypothetical protein